MTLSRKELHGGAIEITTAVNLSIAMGYGRRVQTINTTTAGRTHTLPPVGNVEVPYGQNVLWLLNIGANSFTLVDQEGHISSTINSGKAATLHVIDDLAGVKRFFVFIAGALT